MTKRRGMQRDLFDATDWITNHCKGGEVLDGETFAAISHFTLMWNFFEGAVFNANFTRNNGQLKELHWVGCSESQWGVIDEALTYWASRLFPEGRCSSHFCDLKLRDSDEESVRLVLLRSESGRQLIGTALLKIIWRLRCNLFHGEKTLDVLKSQVQNLDHAARVLSVAFEVSGSVLRRADAHIQSSN